MNLWEGDYEMRGTNMDSFSSVNLTIEMMKVKTDAFGFTNKSLRFNAKI